ncbi:peptide-methionine (S)-S-oxide reductase MsrA [Pirellula sp. SH-Sr6A]|uniref:peptide-methionine (S)-S-oxide reductase MsrA n=1 Tax=Pirellula sp. SH-Sr6A TaxID=1632865 RepID=UPI001F0ACDA2|nr:peptide-methionine (S)-S-oxide reductase MsrA [Pirellula sp. SH-Sr6A]
MLQCKPICRLAPALAAFAILGGMLVAAPIQSSKPSAKSQETPKGETQGEKKLETITVGGGCFWCVEAVFQRVHGVSKVVSGYTGGTKKNPTYKEVCTGLTGHAEVAAITFDPEIVSREQILVIFFKTHDPTTLNRQGADIGTQYRSAVFYTSDEQRDSTEAVIKKINEEKVYNQPIVTEVTPLDVFYPAEDYHQNYFNLNKSNPYCQNVVASKVVKFERLFKEFSVNNKKSKTSKE